MGWKGTCVHDRKATLQELSRQKSGVDTRMVNGVLGQSQVNGLNLAPREDTGLEEGCQSVIYSGTGDLDHKVWEQQS